MTTKPPKLTAADLSNESQVLGAVDALLSNGGNYKRMTKHILAGQQRLQSLCDDDAWLAYLDIEQSVNARVNLMLLTVARWAFQQGKASR